MQNTGGTKFTKSKKNNESNLAKKLDIKPETSKKELQMHFKINDLLTELKENLYRDLNEVYDVFRGVDIDDHNKF